MQLLVSWLLSESIWTSQMFSNLQMLLSHSQNIEQMKSKRRSLNTVNQHPRCKPCLLNRLWAKLCTKMLWTNHKWCRFRSRTLTSQLKKRHSKNPNLQNPLPNGFVVLKLNKHKSNNSLNKTSWLNSYREEKSQRIIFLLSNRYLKTSSSWSRTSLKMSTSCNLTENGKHLWDNLVKKG